MKADHLALPFSSDQTGDTTAELVPAGPADIELLEGEGEFSSDACYHAYMDELKRQRHDDEDVPLGHRHFINRSNWLRAAVLGANDGLVSVASLTIGMAGATENKSTVLLTAVAALVAGALSMAAGEYVSVAAQREIEMADVEKERREQRKGPHARTKEFEEFVQIYIDRGLTPSLARQVAVQMCRHDLIRAHARDELGIDIDDYVNPWVAGLASAVAFSMGACVPIIAVLIPVATQLERIISIIVAVTIALAASGMFGAIAGGAPILRGTLRVLVGGWIAMAVTYGVGKIFGTNVS